VAFVDVVDSHVSSVRTVHGRRRLGALKGQRRGVSSERRHKTLSTSLVRGRPHVQSTFCTKCGQNSGAQYVCQPRHREVSTPPGLNKKSARPTSPGQVTFFLPPHWIRV